MLLCGVEPDNFTYQTLLIAGANFPALEEGMQVHGHYIVSNVGLKGVCAEQLDQHVRKAWRDRSRFFRFSENGAKECCFMECPYFSSCAMRFWGI